MKRMVLVTVFVAIGYSISSCSPPTGDPGSQAGGPEFAISFPEAASSGPITGRVYVMISESEGREPRLQVGTSGVPFFGLDVEQLLPGRGGGHRR